MLYGTTPSGGTYGQGVLFQMSETGAETVLYNFTGGTDGGNPFGRLLWDAAGNLYGTTSRGGTYYSGTVFKMDLTGKETVLYAFKGGTDGAVPQVGLIRDATGNLYGTTNQGGDLTCNPPYGCGTVFKLDRTGKHTVLHTFAGSGGDGKWPFDALLLRDATGNLYGTTPYGGDLTCFAPDGCGIVFKVNAAGQYKVLHTFIGEADGTFPLAGLIRDAAGNLYSTASAGGAYGAGTIFKLDVTGKEVLLHNFFDTNGAVPMSGLVWDPAGNLYGTTTQGGAGNLGVVFKLDTTGKETVLHSFTSVDGAWAKAGLVWNAGNLYGTTTVGGAYGNGVVFKLAP